MEHIKEDRRVMYTKMFLRESLLALLENKPIEKITPTELCRHAGINRNTFYSHYRSPEELLHSIELEVLQKIEASIAREATFVNTLYAIKENEYYCKILLSPHCSRGLWENILKESIARFQRDLRESQPDLPEETRHRIIQFVVNGSIAVVQDWLYSGMHTSPEELSDFLETIAAQSIAAFDHRKKAAT